MKIIKRSGLILLGLSLLLPLAVKAQPAPELLEKLASLQNRPAFADINQLPAPSAPGQAGSHVLALQQALAALSYLNAEEATGLYTLSTLDAVKAFQTDAGLAPTGYAGEETLHFLFSVPVNVPGRTQMPPWYGGGSTLVPFGATFEVKDVRTGIIFTATRMMGESHLDAEPVTKEDTRLMKEAYGGEWSWDRRPILLRYRGMVYAASMNGMPHGYVNNRENGMGGHFCIHFSYSRGDGTQRVDSDHLQAALEASKTSWEDPGTQPEKP